MIDQKPAQKPPFSAHCRNMAANRGAVDHVLPVVGQAEIDQSLQHGIPDALLGPAPEPDVDRVPLPIALMHVAPGAANPQDVQHSIEIAPVISGRASMPALPKSRLESELNRIGNPFCQRDLGATQT